MVYGIFDGTLTELGPGINRNYNDNKLKPLKKVRKKRVMFKVILS